MAPYFLLLVVLSLLGYSQGDTPANCTYGDIQGRWTFHAGDEDGDRWIDCTEMGDVAKVYTVDLQFPDLAVDDFGNRGYWTLIYNQGFEVVIHGRSFFAFSKYTGSYPDVTSICNETFPGWTHDVGGNHWACFVAQKIAPVSAPKVNKKITTGDGLEHLYKHDPDYIKEINSAQKLWKATEYPEYQNMTIGQMMQRAGGGSSAGGERLVRAIRPSREVQEKALGLPDEFDWRDVNGINYISPIRNQGGCGSCYAFASTAMLEARFRIVTNKTIDVTLSPQDVLDCSNYAQACRGGFPYLIGGKYAEDYGLVEESCSPYQGRQKSSCKTDSDCRRYYAYGYRYVGGFYGGCSEPDMRIALVNNGPIAVSYMVYGDFYNYKSGIYVHSGVSRRFNPFEVTSHVVTIVGYGKDAESGILYWIVQNSWGNTWGEQGFFRIRRGTDECGIESLVAESFPAF